jgi:hypothetical protein
MLTPTKFELMTGSFYAFYLQADGKTQSDCLQSQIVIVNHFYILLY